MARIYQCYHKHSDWTNPTITDSVATLKDYALRAKELGHSIISSCEHGTQGNYRMCYELAKEHGLRWRYVTEAYFVKDRNESDRTNAHMILAAKTAKGVGDLNFALSEANISGFYFHPRLDLDLLSTLSPNDVFITTACVGGVFKYGLEEAERLICWLHAHFKDSFMLEVQANNTEKQKEINRFLLSMYRKYGIPLIAGTDSHMIHPEEAQLRTMRLEANGLHYDDEDGWDMDYPDGDELYRRFVEQGVLSPAQIEEAISNTNVFLTFEDIEFDKSKKLPNPLFPYLTQEERNQKYRDIVYAAWDKFSVGMTEEQKKPYLDAIEYEVNTITSTNTSDYFLIDYYMVKEAKANGGVITRTGRGSGASYFTNTLLGFSSIDRLAIPVTMYPDRFISADRLASGSLPDLDLNVANEEVFEAAQAKIMGEWRSARMVAFGKLKLLSAWKMYCRAANVPYETANEMADHLRRYETDLRHADEEEAEDMNVYDYIPPEFHAIFDMSEKYQGMIERISPSPCSYVLCTEDVRREFGLIRLTTKSGTKKTIFAAYIDGATAERFGYLKNDILHVDVVKLNEAIYSAIGMKQPTVKELLAMCPPSDDAWRMYDRGLTMGLNQVERDKSTEKAMRYRPRNISEMSALVAGIRPSFQSLINTLLDRKRFVYDIPALDNLLQTREMPNSFILYQEQLMAILQYGGFTPPESYAAIKAIAKKHPEKVLPLKEKFMLGFKNKLVQSGTELSKSDEATCKVWDIIADSCNYSFNSAHAVAVALDSLYTAWAKAHYPLETYATLLQIYAAKDDKDRIMKARVEMDKGFGIRMVPCKFREDNRSFRIDKEHMTISDALFSCKHISKRNAEALWRMRDNLYFNFVEVLQDLLWDPAFNARQIKALITMGYFSEFGGAKKLLKIFEQFENGKDRITKSLKDATTLKRINALIALEESLPDEELPLAELLSFEAMHYGAPMTVNRTARSTYVVMEVDDKYSPKIKLYSAATGRVGVMKIKKPIFSKAPLRKGDVIDLLNWVKRPAYRYVDGKSKSIPGVDESWIVAYDVLWKAVDEKEAKEVKAS